MSRHGTAVSLKPRDAILRMKEYHPPLSGRRGLRLDFNENTVECSPRVMEALRSITPADLTRYPEREHAEAAVAEHFHLHSDQVLLTNGVDEAIHILCQTYLGHEDEILLPVPTYSMYEVYASATEGRIISVQAEQEFHFPARRLKAAINDRTRIIAIANPNSPTGQVVTRDEILSIAERAPQAALLVDEAYFHFFGETLMGSVGKIPNLFVARTFSKAYGLAGLRLGAIAGNPGNIGWLRRVISPYSVNSVAVECLKAALSDSDYLDSYVAEVLAARDEVTTALRDLGLRFWPSQANFVLVMIGSKHSQFCSAMRDRGVLVRDRSNDPGCDGCVRITIGTRSQMETAIDAMRESLSEIGGDS